MDKIVAITFPFFVIDNIVFSITFESSRFYKMESNAPLNEQFGESILDTGFNEKMQEKKMVFSYVP
jgi:hypothetical protein